MNAGEQKLNGKQALAFARHRHSYVNQDLGRNQAQQQVMKGMMKKAMSLSGISKLDDLLDTVSKYVSTNLTSDQISNFASAQLEGKKNWTIRSLYLDKGAFDTRMTCLLYTSGSNELVRSRSSRPASTSSVIAASSTQRVKNPT